MTFDPFGDFETRGYLRNLSGEKDIPTVKRMEHRSFLAGLDDAIAYLGRQPTIGYDDIRQVHHILFDAVYPWAGEDRSAIAADLAVTRGPVMFAHPQSVRMAAEYGLRLGNEPQAMRERPGEVMGYLAHAHPFLDGNGRTLMVTHIMLAARAGISIAWPATDRQQYIECLTQELNEPGKGHLDRYLEPFIGTSIGMDNLPAQIMAISGLRGTMSDEVAASKTDPELRTLYDHGDRRVGRADTPADETRELDDGHDR
jgi:cell filamentation protein